ncbi:MAG: hypothetical protein Q9166_001732 [cf. Caloplaca sp. 2 TL-2023]
MVRKTIHFDTADPKALRNAWNESQQRYLDHPNIARYIDADWGDDHVNFYMEYFEDGSLDSLKNSDDSRRPKVSQDQVWAIVYQLSAAIAYCHDPEKKLREIEADEGIEDSMRPTPIYHRDIKPQNILRANVAEDSLEALKLCDFGVSFILEGSAKPTTYAGTPQYKPPEIKRGDSDWSTKSDIYSLGCTLYEICNGHTPFERSPDNAKEAKYPTIAEYYNDDELRKCITDCLSFDKDGRPEAAEIHAQARKKLENTKYNDSLTHESLMEAVEEGSCENIERLLPKDRDKDFVDGSGYTLLHRAVQHGRMNVVKQLLEKGFSALSETEDHQTPIHIALELMTESEPRLRRLKSKLLQLETGKLNPLEPASGLTSGGLEAKIKVLESTNRPGFHIFQMLVDSGKKYKSGIWRKFYPPRGWTLLHAATAADVVDTVKAVLEDEPNWDMVTEEQEWSLLHIAARNGHVKLLAFLLERSQFNSKAQIERRSRDGATPLFEASKGGQARAVDLLIERGANTNVRTTKEIEIRQEERRSHMTALHIAALKGHYSTIDKLLSCQTMKVGKALTDMDETALHLAVQRSHDSCPKIIGVLLEHINNIEAVARLKAGHNVKEKYTALHMAIANKNYAATQKLLGLGANPNAKTKDDDTPLHLAAREGLKNFAQELLKYNARSDLRNHSKATPLHEAIECSMHRIEKNELEETVATTQTAKLLIQHDKKSVSGLTREGGRALQLASRIGNLTIVKAAYACDEDLVDKKDNHGNTALHLAAREDHLKIVKYLWHDTKAKKRDQNQKHQTPSQIAKGRCRQFLNQKGQ